MDHLFSEDKSVLTDNEPVVDELFNKGICEKSSPKMKFLIGPISSQAELRYCPRPEKLNFKKPEVKFQAIELIFFNNKLTNFWIKSTKVDI